MTKGAKRQYTGVRKVRPRLPFGRDGKEKELRKSQLLDSESAPEPGLEPGTL